MEKKNKTIHEDHRKRMKEVYLKNGLDAFSDIEKLEFILYFGVARKYTNPIAHRLLDEFGSFDKVLEAPIEKLARIEGVGEHTAILLSLLLKVTSAYGKSKCENYIPGTNSAKKYCENLFKGKNVEEFYVICLTSSNRVTSCTMINRGTISEVAVDIRKLTNLAMSSNCERMILAHNHPQGLPRPSDEDVVFTSKILFSCILNSIEVLDHIIVSDVGSFSFEEAGILKELKHDAVRRLPIDKKSMDRFGQESFNYRVDTEDDKKNMK